MATTTEPRESSEQYVDFDEYISFQLERTRSNVRLTDLLTAVVGAGAMAVLYLLVFVVLDHWAFPGGLPQIARTSMLAVLALATIGWLVWKLAVPYMRHVNALFAARLIEKSHPELKSSLLNLVDLERSGREVPEDIRRAIEKRAAVTLSHVDVDQSVDRRALMRLSYALFIAVVLFCLYAVLSPKKPWSSIWRAIMPASSVAVSTRTEIIEVKPGDVELLARSQLEVLADLRGEIPEHVVLYYTTLDRKFVDEPIEMRPVDEFTKQFRALVTGDNGRGLLQNLTYRIEAGDARTRDYDVTVIQPPSAVVESLQFEFPPYMEMSPSNHAGGNIDAWEGTTVTLTGRANVPIRSATLRFSDNEDFSTRAEEVTAKVAENVRISASWKLTIRSDGTHPQFYHLQCRNDKGESDPEPILYTVRIRPDQAPDVALISPKGDLDKPANALIPLVVEARDPDFKLRRISLRIEKDGEELIGPQIFEGMDQGFRGSFDWDLGKHNLKPGDILSFWIEAQDNKQPVANRKNTPKLRIRIGEPISKQEAQQQLAEDKQKLRDEKLLRDDRPNDQNGENNGEELADAKQPPGRQDQNDQVPNDDQPDRKNDQNNNGDREQNATDKLGEDPQNQKQGDQRRDDQNSGEGKRQLDPDDDADTGDVLDKIVERQKEREDEQKRGSEIGKDGDRSERQPSDSPDQKGVNKQPGESGESGDKNREQDALKNDPSRSARKQPGSKNDLKSQANPQDSGEDNSANPPKNESDSSPKQGDPSGRRKNPSQQNDNDTGDQNEKTGDNESKADKLQDKAEPNSTDKDNENAAQDERDPNTKNRAEKSKNGVRKPDEQNANDEKNGAKNPNNNTKQDASSDANDHGADSKPNPAEDAQPNDEQQKDGTGGKPADDAAGAPKKESRGKDNDSKPTERESSKNTDKGAQNKSGEPAAGKSDPRQGKQKNQENKRGNDDPTGDKPADAKNSSDQKPSENAEPTDKPQADSQRIDKKPDGDPHSVQKMKPKEKPRATNDEKSPAGDAAKPKDSQTKQPMDAAPAGDAAAESGKKGTGDAPPSEGKADEGQSRKEAAQGKGDEPGQEAAPGEKVTKPTQQKSEDGAPGEKETQDPGKPAGEGKPQGESKKDAPQGAGEGEGEAQGGGAEDPAGNSSVGEQGESAVGKGGHAGKAAAGAGKDQGEGNEGGEGKEGQGNGQGAGAESADEADLEAAKKATNLVLRKLEDEISRGEVDQKLLEELGWTEEQIRRFTERLKKSLEPRELPDDAAARARQRQFEETLKSLNFQSRGTKRSGETIKKRATEEVGPRRTAPPAEYREYYEAFTRSLSKQNAKKPAAAGNSDTKK